MTTLASPLPTRRSLRRTMAGLAPVSLAVQVCSFVSSIALAHVLGATVSTDAYYLGLSVPVLTYGILLGAIRSGAIPALTDTLTARGEGGLKRSAGELFSAVAAASFALTLVISAAAFVTLPLIVDGRLLSETRLVVVELLPYGVLGALTGVLAAVLGVRGIFALPVVVMMFEPVLKALLTIVLGSHIGIQALIIGNLAGAALAVLSLWIALRRNGILVRPTRGFATPFVRQTARLSIPLIASMSVLQINPVVDRVMASGLGAGRVTALDLGLRLFLVPAGLLTSLLIGPITATWSARFATEGWRAVQQSASRAITLAAAVLPPLVIVGVVLRQEVVDLLFAGGAYSATARTDTASVFAMILLALPTQMLVVLFSTMFVVRKDTVFPLKVAVGNVVLNVLLNLVLRPIFGVGGIALSTALTLTILLVIYVRGARRRWGPFYTASARALTARVIASVVVTAGLALLVRSLLPEGDTRPEQLLVIALVTAVALAGHVATLHAMRDPIVGSLVASLRRRKVSTP